MTIAGRTVEKRTDAVEALRTWADRNAAGRPPINGSKDLGVMASIGGHDIRFIQRETNMVEMGASRVDLQIEGASGVAVELKRNDALFPTVGVIQRLENQVTRLPDEVVKRERQLEETRQEYRDAVTALNQPFKHTEALEKAKWEVERISREMRGEDGSQTTLTPELEDLKRHMRVAFPNPPKPGQAPDRTAGQHRTSNVPGLGVERSGGIEL
ncbi:hypothetical protein [Arthrobacter sp. H5]|uniref:hypothetical protein n=1 Tax=Arthrobacter sp. H5 TaxID=1267973 RepID=UPI0020A66F93|nr:hypothetical protein [Arthrobacter sp. H5]